jgi:site-specific DNA-methyltransferase (adenine-specific)
MKADSAFFDLAAGGMEVDFERVVGKLKPGAHLLALSPIATHHSNTIDIEDAGMEIRDTVVWVFDSGKQTPDMALVTVARKPLEGTVAENTLKYGTGGLNIDGCRVEGKLPSPCKGTGWAAQDKKNAEQGYRPSSYYDDQDGVLYTPSKLGRWPANLLHDNSPITLAMFPNTGSGNGRGGYCYAGREYDNKDSSMFNGDKPQAPSNYNDNGSAARFFYSAPHLDDLLKYLLKLITPPGGTVLTNCDNILVQSAYPSVKYHED